jgi:hypothetical protein
MRHASQNAAGKRFGIKGFVNGIAMFGHPARAICTKNRLEGQKTGRTFASCLVRREFCPFGYLSHVTVPLSCQNPFLSAKDWV